MKLLPVLMAGGSGTRLWPLSREQFPKQFLRLTEDQSLLQATARRALALPDVVPPLAVCGDKHRFIVAEQMQNVAPGVTVLLEPEGRNTAPAAAVAAMWAAETHGPDTLVFLMAADHVIPNQKAFAAATAIATTIAEEGRIVTFGITPTHPETGFGYMRAGKKMAGGAYSIAQFVEKPPLAKAQEYLAHGDYFWNGGMFLFKASVFLKELKRLEPEIYKHAQQSLAKAARDLDFVRLDPPSFKHCRNESIDYAVMEKTKLAALVPLDAGWDDVGSWTFLDKLPKDAQGNVSRGDVMLEDANNNLVHASSRLVTLVGVNDHVVVETPDALMIAPKSRVQDVKKIVARIKLAGRSEADMNARVLRPWGSYETVAISDRFQVKRIIVKPGHKLSLQMHHHRAEHWVVVKGTALVTCGDKISMLTEDQSTYIPLGQKHRLENPGKVPLELIEVQSGGYLGEDDIVRFEDVYNRA